VTTVTWLKNITIWAMLALWLPATNHCRLEQIPSLNFLACSDHEGGNGTGQEEDCQTDGCALVEGGFYKTERNQVEVAQSHSAVSKFLGPPESSRPRLDLVAWWHHPSVPPEIPVRWQFFFRAAAQPRAPSVAS
jgi:hypothetical protein